MKADEVLARKRSEHPELLAPLTWRAMQRVLEREGVSLVIRPISNHARLLHFEGSWAIVVSSRLPADRRVFYVAHELAHLWLHADTLGQTYPPGEDPREREADDFAVRLISGARARRLLRARGF